MSGRLGPDEVEVRLSRWCGAAERQPYAWSWDALLAVDGPVAKAMRERPHRPLGVMFKGEPSRAYFHVARMALCQAIVEEFEL